MAVTFPSYAKILFNGYSQKRESALMRTDMDAGPPKQVKVRSKPMIVHGATVMLASKNDFLMFQNWYINDINEGASWFLFTDPVTKAVIQGRIRDGGYTATPTGSMDNWQVQLQIEVWG